MFHVSRLPVLLLASSIAAQLSPGDVGVVGFSTTDFGVIRQTNATGYSTPGYGGTGASQSILWDPANPQDFLIGGLGFIGRATITGPGTVSYTNLTTSLGTAAQISFDFAGNVVIADGGVDQVRLLDLTTNTVTDLTTGAQPWGTTINAGAFNPSTGDIIIGNQGNLYRLPSASSTPTLLASNLGGYLTGITFDVNGDVICTVVQQNRLVRVDNAGTVTDIIPPGTIADPNAIDRDLNFDWIVGGQSGRVYRVPHGGGLAVLIGTNVSPPTTVSGVAVVGGPPTGSWTTFGTRCNGQFGPVAVGILGTVAPGQVITHISYNHAPNQLGVALYGLSATTYSGNALPYSLDSLLGTNGCFLNVAIDATQTIFSTGASPARMGFVLSIPPLPTGAAFFIQHACFEPVPGNTSWSNAVYLQLP